MREKLLIIKWFSVFFVLLALLCLLIHQGHYGIGVRYNPLTTYSNGSRGTFQCAVGKDDQKICTINQPGQSNPGYLRSVVKDIPPDEETVCGISWLWAVPDDPFTPCCIIHDAECRYAAEHPGELVEIDVSNRFFACCTKIAGQSWTARQRAKIYYYAVRIWANTIRRGDWK